MKTKQNTKMHISEYWDTLAGHTGTLWVKNIF